MTVKQASKLLRLSPWTVTRLCREGRLKAVKISSPLNRVEKWEIDETALQELLIPEY